MIAPDHHASAGHREASESAAIAALGPGTELRLVPLPTGETLELALVPVEEGSEPAIALAGATTAGKAAGDWVAAAATATPPPAAWEPAPPTATLVPLYGCLVAWAPARAAVVGPADRLDQLAAAVVAFAACEAKLRAAEAGTLALLEAAEVDAAEAGDLDAGSADRRQELAGRYRDAVAVSRRLALLAPAALAPPLHPPTLASQLGERLRDRTRLAERHALTVERAELAERVAEAASQRANEFGIARRQMALEWAIVVLLVVQTALLVVEIASRQGAS